MHPLEKLVIFVLTVAACQQQTSTLKEASSSRNAHVMKSTKRLVALYVAAKGMGKVPAMLLVDAKSERYLVFECLCLKLLITC